MFELLLAAFVLSPILSLGILAVLFIALVISTTVDEGRYGEGSAWGAFIFGPVALTLFVIFNVKGFHFDIHALRWLLPGIIVYGVIGGVWSVIKWFGRVKRWESNTIADIAKNNLPKEVYAEAPLAANNKGQIGYWIAYWPFSAIGTVFHNVITKFVENIRRIFNGMYNSISSRSERRVAEALRIREERIAEAEAKTVAADNERYA